MSALIIVGLVLPWVVVAVGCWIGFQLMRQNGRILLRLDRLEQQLAQLAATAGAVQPAAGATSAAASLPLGSSAPDFELPDLSGVPTSLSQYRGRRVLLVFFNPQCGFCTQMGADLAALPIDEHINSPLPVVVTSGDLTANRQLVAQYDIQCPVLIQKQNEVAERYRVTGTPMGYLIDEEGRIASAVAAGAEALLALARAPTTEAVAAGIVAPTEGNGRKAYRGNAPLSQSRIIRDGLKAGTPAPEFSMPRLDGGELSLSGYRGRRVLLVFSDPQCGPCDALACELEALHRRTADVQLIMVSRGDVAENQAKVAKHGLTFPVVLQQQWEISRLYGMFATPIAYLIDERGIVAADVAVGPEPILALGSRALSITSEQGKEMATVT